MKKILLIVVLFYSLSNDSMGQLLDGYKYIYVETLSYGNRGTDIWGISAKVRSNFSIFGLNVLTESSISPKELAEDPCMLLWCIIQHTYVLSGVNEVTITLKNCKDEIVFSNTGSAMGWSLQDDYNKATKRAFSKLEYFDYEFNPTKTPKVEFPRVEMTHHNEESIKSYLTISTTSPLEGIYKSYQSDQVGHYRIGIVKKENKFIAIILESHLKHWKIGEVKAIFENSSMPNLFSTKWYSGNKTSLETFAILEENGILAIDSRDPITGESKPFKFIKIYPSGGVSKKPEERNIKSTGSGFFITKSGIIATNAHVVEGASKIEVTVSHDHGALSYNAKLLIFDKSNDVALLQIEDSRFEELNFIPYQIVETTDIGAKVYTIGYPLSNIMGSNFKLTDGIVSSTSGINDDIRYFQISVPLQPGNSGGPLFNKDGNIIGITTSRLNSSAVGAQVENVNYAIKSPYLLNLYNMLPNAPKLSTTSTLINKDLSEQVKVLKYYVCLISVN